MIFHTKFVLQVSKNALSGFKYQLNFTCNNKNFHNYLRAINTPAQLSGMVSTGSGADVING